MINLNDINRNQNNLSTPFKELYIFFKELDAKLDRTDPEWHNDRDIILIHAEKELIMWGKI